MLWLIASYADQRNLRENTNVQLINQAPDMIYHTKKKVLVNCATNPVTSKPVCSTNVQHD